MVTPRPIILCADDFALSSGVSRAIVALAENGRLSAAGCMTASPLWPEHAAWITPVCARNGGTIAVGLHLTLTELSPLTAMPRFAPGGRFGGNGRLILRALGGGLNDAAVRAELAAEIAAQLDAFEAATGAAPDFIDGHHHVHQLPVIRDLVIAAFQARCDRSRAWLRVCCEPPAVILRRPMGRARALVIDRLGRGLRSRVRAAGLRHNDGFRGVRDFAAGEDFGRLMADALQGPGPSPGATPLIMCHPGSGEDVPDAGDHGRAVRQAEYAFLSGPAFPVLLDEAGAVLVPGPGIGAAR